MNKEYLKSICSVNTNFQDDVFVGIAFDESTPKVTFPLGFNLAKDDTGIRKDILLILSLLNKTNKQRGQASHHKEHGEDHKDFPLRAYQKVVLDYLSYGYFSEMEVHYKQAKRGKIDWNRTIKTQNQTYTENGAVYLNFVVKKTDVNTDNIVTLIHEHCVYESFHKIGWLYTTYKPNKPRIKFNKPMFISALKSKLIESFNDDTCDLLHCMIQIIQGMDNERKESFNNNFGTFEFEYVWEQMIDSVFGIKDKQSYFPNTKWHINGDKEGIPNHCLEPDTIMKKDANIYIIDAKYYKYGMIKNPVFLPNTSSIHKQITYGEFIEQLGYQNVYNVFLMPYNKEGIPREDNPNYLYIGYATSDWKGNQKPYEYIHAFLVDVKHLIVNFLQYNISEADRLSSKIDVAVKALID